MSCRQQACPAFIYHTGQGSRRAGHPGLEISGPWQPTSFKELQEVSSGRGGGVGRGEAGLDFLSFHKLGEKKAGEQPRASGRVVLTSELPHPQKLPLLPRQSHVPFLPFVVTCYGAGVEAETLRLWESPFPI